MVRTALLALALATSTLAPPAFAMRLEAVPGVLERAVDDFIRPGYRDLHEAAADTERQMSSLCLAPTEDGLQTARGAFDSLVEAWSHIEIVRVGPAIENYRFERFLYYPDRKSIGLKQVQALLAKPDESATDAKSLAGKSVAMQGLGALEFVLFGTGSETLSRTPHNFRCRYGAAIAGNLENVSAELTTEWEKPDGVQQAWKHPGPENPIYRSAEEAVTGLLGILVHSVEATKDQRLQAFYSGPDERTRPKSAIYWRSDNTFPSISGNVRAVQDLWKTAKMADLLDDEFRSVAGSAEFVMTSVLRVADDVNQPVDELVESKAGRAKLDFLLLNMNDLLDRMNRDYGGAIGLGAGFSFADGD